MSGVMLIAVAVLALGGCLLVMRLAGGVVKLLALLVGAAIVLWLAWLGGMAGLVGPALRR